MSTLLEKQRNLVVKYDTAIAFFRGALTKRGIRPVPILVTIAGNNIESALARRKHVLDSLYHQWNDLTKGVIRK